MGVSRWLRPRGSTRTSGIASSPSSLSSSSPNSSSGGSHPGWRGGGARGLGASAVSMARYGRCACVKLSEAKSASSTARRQRDERKATKRASGSQHGEVSAKCPSVTACTRRLGTWHSRMAEVRLIALVLSA